MNVARGHYAQLILDYFKAVNEERLDDIIACFTEDGSIRFAFHDEPIVGREALRAFFAGHVATFSAHVDRVTRILVDSDLGISEIVFDAITRDGYPVHLETCNVYLFRDGLFHDARVYLDTLTMQRQLTDAS